MITCILENEILFTLFGQLARSLLSLADVARSSLASMTHLAKSLLAPHIPFYVSYIKDARYFLYHDESKDFLAAGVGFDTVEEEKHMQHNGRGKAHKFRSKHAVSS